MNVSPNPEASEILRVLRDRDGTPTEVRTKPGQTYLLYNIAWGQDMNDPEFHITSNISPSVNGRDVDFFFTHEVIEVRAPETGQVLFAKRAV